jgi:hypothetical protein
VRIWESHIRPGLKLIGSIVMIASAGAFFYGVTHQGDGPRRRDRYGCLADQPPAAHTFVVIDRTDAYSSAQAQSLRNELIRIGDAIEPGEMLTIATIGSDLPAAIAFRGCSPERGDVPGIVESLRRDQDWLAVKREYEQSFLLPIHKLAEGIRLDQSSPHSPIIQSLAGVLQELGPSWSRAARRKVTLVSDLIENTRAFSQYDMGDSARSFGEVRANVPYIRDTALDLRGAAITVLYLTGMPSDRDRQGPAHQRFWMDLVGYYGGNLIDWVVVPAAAESSH